MGEYAYDFTGENIHDGPSRNPHDLKRMTGGSTDPIPWRLCQARRAV
jgi:hypothetical protein